MNIRLAIMALGILTLASCHHRKAQKEQTLEPTPTQQKLLDIGWIPETPEEELTED